MAALAGVESAVQVHIDRGDDLNACDDKGQTPLMLAASRNRAGVCRLLIAAGADAQLLDPLGRDALGIAQSAGAQDAVVVLASACETSVVSTSDDDPEGHTHLASETLVVADANVLGSKDPRTAVTESAFTSSMYVDDSSSRDEFDIGGWEAEEDQPPPEGDATLSSEAFHIQSAITAHIPIDSAAAWDDFEAFLPERATPLLRADDVDARERLRLLLLRAIREGSVPSFAIEDLTRGNDDEPDPEVAAMLGMVINDLGAETDERFEYSAPHESFKVFVSPDEAPDEESVIAEALDFVDDLGSRRNEPLRLYQREFQREALLSAEAEVTLGQAMEHSIESALDALATWPRGVSDLLDAARKVVAGEKPLRWMAVPSRGESEEADPSIRCDSTTETDARSEALPEGEAEGSREEGAVQDELGEKESVDDLVEFRCKAERLSCIVVGSQDSPAWSACRSTLTALRLARGFLLELAESVRPEDPTSAQIFAQAMSAYRHSRDKMAVANLKLVLSIAKKYLFSGQPLDDLLQEGNIGLLKAVDRYDWRRGFKFSTYATWWIRQQVGRFVADNGKTIRLPVHVYEKTQRIAQAAHAYEIKHGRAPTAEELSVLVGLPAPQIVAFLQAALEPLSLHELLDLDDMLALDAKEQFTVRDPMELIANMQLTKSVDEVLGWLKPKEERIVRMRYGIGLRDSLTLEQIGERLDLTRERIRQIEAKAIRRLKHPARLKQLSSELGLPQPPQPNQPNQPDEVSSDSDDEANSEMRVPPASTAAPKPKPAPVDTPGALKRVGSDLSPLEKVLGLAREVGVGVEDYVEGDSRRLWVYITNTPDSSSKKLVRRLIDLDFKLWPGKGYWR